VVDLRLRGGGTWAADLGVRGAAGKAANLGGCKSLYRQLPDNGRLVYPLLGEVTNQDMRGSKSHGCLEGCWNLAKDYGSRIEGRSESDGTPTEPYGTVPKAGKTTLCGRSNRGGEQTYGPEH